MPAPKPINPDLVRALFSYDATSGQLVPKDLASRAARRINSKQWEIGPVQYSLHRLVWAWHNHTSADAANPTVVRFLDGNRANTRIENLTAMAEHPRWAGHKKARKARIDHNGMVVYEDLMEQAYEAKLGL